MFKKEVKTEKFDTDDAKDLARYNDICSNELCSIISEKREKLTTKYFDDEGKLTSSDDRLILVVTWMEKTTL
jgi:hypothetical protein